MSIYSNLNGNLGKTPEQVAAVDMEKNRVKGPNDDLLVDPTDLGKTSKRTVFLAVIAIAVVACLAFSIIGKMKANENIGTFSISAMKDGSEIELYENQVKVNAFENGEWIYKEAPFVKDNLEKVVLNLPVVVWNEAFELIVPEGAKIKWFDIYDEAHTNIRRFAEEREVNEFLVDAEPATYYVIAGASWEGKYVLRSFTYESFSSEFGLAVVKE